ncbi:hypothetical protein OSTOST_14795 [Ostertagia ostertagi]
MTSLALKQRNPNFTGFFVQIFDDVSNTQAYGSTRDVKHLNDDGAFYRSLH